MGFLLEYLKNPRFIGAVAPSGINLSRRMIRPINFKTAKVIVEYGPGNVFYPTQRVRQPSSFIYLGDTYSQYNEQLCF